MKFDVSVRGCCRKYRATLITAVPEGVITLEASGETASQARAAVLEMAERIIVGFTSDAKA